MKQVETVLPASILSLFKELIWTGVIYVLWLKMIRFENDTNKTKIININGLPSLPGPTSSEFPACCKSLKVPPCHVIQGIMASSRRRLMYVRSGALSLLFYCVYSHLQLVLSEEAENCQNLRLGQYPSVRVYRALTPHYRGHGTANVSLASLWHSDQNVTFGCFLGFRGLMRVSPLIE